MKFREGSQDEETETLFLPVGKSVPLTRSLSQFDADSAPIQGIAISNRFGLAFVATPKGFCVIKTSMLLQCAKDQNGKGEVASTVEDACMVSISLPSVRLLALSRSNLNLVACEEGRAHFFHVPDLIYKGCSKPAKSQVICESQWIKAFLWSTRKDDECLVITSGGLAFSGNAATTFQLVRENVLAADWSPNGQDVAFIMKENKIKILSSGFEQRLSLELPSQLQLQDTDADIRNHVDNMKWIKEDSMIVGCIGENEEGEQVQYSVYTLIFRIENGSKKQYFEIFAFETMFFNTDPTILSPKAGPYLLSDYLDVWDIALVSNRREISEHIGLLAFYPQSEEKVVQLLIDDNLAPRIELQDNENDNIIVGMGVDRTSIDYQIGVPKDDGTLEPRSWPLLMCLTLEAKLVLYSIARSSEEFYAPGLVLAPTEVPKSDLVEVENKEISQDSRSISIPVNEQEMNMQKLTDSTKQSIQSFNDSASDKHASCGNTFASNTQGLQNQNYQKSSELKVSGQTETNVLETNLKSFVLGQTLSQNVSSKSLSEAVSQEKLNSKLSFSNPLSVGDSYKHVSGKESFLKDPKGHAEERIFGSYPTMVMQTSVNVPSSATSSCKGYSSPLQPSFGFSSKSSSGFLGSTNNLGSNIISVTTGTASSSQFGSSSFIKPVGSLDSIRQPLQHSLVASKSVQPGKNVAQPAKQPVTEIEAEFLKEIEKVRKMSSEIDDIMLSIEDEHKISNKNMVTFKKRVVIEIENEIRKLSKECSASKRRLGVQSMEVRNLHDHVMQVDALRIYVQSIIEQSIDIQYQYLRNCQKLSTEAEAMRERVLKEDQRLKSEILELEKHLQNLEINVFEDLHKSSKGHHTKSSQTGRHLQSLQSLYNTVNYQIAVAERLSESLSQQMKALNLSLPAERGKKSEESLFETAELSPEKAQFSSPNTEEKAQRHPQLRRVTLSPSSIVSKDSPDKKLSGPRSLQEPDSVRRRRDLNNCAWANVGTPKTTVKRALPVAQPLPFNNDNQHRTSLGAGSYVHVKPDDDKSYKGSGSPAGKIQVPILFKNMPTSDTLKNIRGSSNGMENFSTKATSVPVTSSHNTDATKPVTATVSGGPEDKKAGESFIQFSKPQTIPSAGQLQLSFKSPIDYTTKLGGSVTGQTTRSLSSEIKAEISAASISEAKSNLVVGTSQVENASSKPGVFVVAGESVPSLAGRKIDDEFTNTKGESQSFSSMPFASSSGLGNRTSVSSLSSSPVSKLSGVPKDSTGETTGQSSSISSSTANLFEVSEGLLVESTTSLSSLISKGLSAESKATSWSSVCSLFGSTGQSSSSFSSSASNGFELTKGLSGGSTVSSSIPVSSPFGASEGLIKESSPTLSSSFTSPLISFPKEPAKQTFSFAPSQLAVSASSLSSTSSAANTQTSAFPSATSGTPVIQSSASATSSALSSASFQSATSATLSGQSSAFPSAASSNQSFAFPSSSATSSIPFSAFPSSSSTTSYGLIPSITVSNTSSTASPTAPLFSGFSNFSVTSSASSASVPTSPFVQVSSQPSSNSPAFGSLNAFQQSQAASGFGPTSISRPLQAASPTFSFASAQAATSSSVTVAPTDAKEEAMEEETSTQTNLTDTGLGNFGAFGLGSTPSSTPPKTNPFGGSFQTAQSNSAFSASTTANAPFSNPSVEMFRPASFSLPPAAPSTPQPSSSPFGSLSGISSPAAATASGFGQPARPGQQALGTALGSFGQSRQLGFGNSISAGFGSPNVPGSGFGVPAGAGGGFASVSRAPGFHGFAAAATASGFAGIAANASPAGGFAAAATASGFAGIAANASPAGGFAGAASGFAGIAANASPAGGFAGAAPGGGFSGHAANASAGGGFSAFGGAGFSQTPSTPPANSLFTQMRR